MAPSDRCLCLNWQKCLLTPYHASTTQQNPFLPRTATPPPSFTLIMANFCLASSFSLPPVSSAPPLSPPPPGHVYTPLFTPNLFIPLLHGTQPPFHSASSHTHSAPSYRPTLSVHLSSDTLILHAETWWLEWRCWVLVKHNPMDWMEHVILCIKSFSFHLSRGLFCFTSNECLCRPFCAE